ncbi:MAG: phosphate acetyltransferase [Clostridia bacterium]|nr:phosphate acetyltransferase [Clostridia bacterium]
MFKVDDLLEKAKVLNKTIVFPEADYSPRVLEAVEIVLKKNIAKVILLGDAESLTKKSDKIKNATIINPKTSDLMSEFVEKLVEIRKSKGLTPEDAKKLLEDNFYFACMLVQCGYADGFVGGAETATSDVLRPALQIIKTKPGIKTASSCVLMIGTDKMGFGENNVVVAGDCSLNINPTAEQLADIALATAESAKKFCNITPKVAMLSFSSFGSGGNSDESILKVREALKLVKEKDSELIIDGEMQLDCALIESVGKLKGKGSKVAGQANVLVFPDLNSGNIGYKLMERFGGLQAVGIIMQGFNKAINDLSRGCCVNDIVVMTAVTALQAQE